MWRDRFNSWIHNVESFGEDIGHVLLSPLLLGAWLSGMPARWPGVLYEIAIPAIRTAVFAVLFPVILLLSILPIHHRRYTPFFTDDPFASNRTSVLAAFGWGVFGCVLGMTAGFSVLLAPWVLSTAYMCVCTGQMQHEHHIRRRTLQLRHGISPVNSPGARRVLLRTGSLPASPVHSPRVSLVPVSSQRVSLENTRQSAVLPVTSPRVSLLREAEGSSRKAKP